MDIAFVEHLAAWSNPKDINTKYGPRKLRKANVTPAFSAAWKTSKDEIKALGANFAKDERSGQWELVWWIKPTGPEEQKLRSDLEASSKASADIQVPVPVGLAYMPFQLAGIQYALGRTNTLIGDEMGLGKTIQVIGYINARPDIEKVIIVCPKSLKLNWAGELKKWLVRPLSIGLVNGEWPESQITIINYEGLKKYWGQIQNQTYDLCVLDEAHYIKNAKAQRSKNAKAIKSKYKLRLTGTPIVNRPAELWNIVEDLSDGWGKFFSFARRYCNPPEAPIWMGDFSFKPIGNVVVGDTVIGWRRDNERPWRKKRGKQVQANPGWNKRRLVKSVVTAVHRHHSRIVKITMESGRIIRCTPDHLWLSGKSYQGAERFVPAQFPGGILCHAIEPTEPVSLEDSIKAAWLGGMFDGEGTWPTISQSPSANPETTNRIAQVLKDLKFDYSIGRSREGFLIRGGRKAAVRFLNLCQPVKIKRIENGILTTKFVTPDEIVGIEWDGEGEVFGLTTDTGNYIAWGYCSKNCNAQQTRWGWDFSGASNLDELHRRLRERVMVRRLKKDVLTELPSKIRQIIELEPDQDMRQRVDAELNFESKMEASLVELRAAVELSKAESDEVYKAAVAKLRQAQGVQFSQMSRLRHETAMAKLPLACDHLQSILEDDPDKKIVVMAHHRDLIASLMEFADRQDWQPVQITGENTDQERQEAVVKFQNDPACRLFVGSITAAGVGITLTASSHVVFAELDWVPGNVSQAEDRCHRIGQKDTVLVQHLVFQDSLDARMAKMIVAKQAVIDRALDIKPGEPEPVYEPKDLPATHETKPSDLNINLTPEQVVAIHSGLRYVAGLDGDHARALNNIGFSKADVIIGHSLAERSFLSPKQAALGMKLCKKYRRQIPEDYLGIIFQFQEA